MLTMARGSNPPISGKPRGEWIWREVRGPANVSAAAAVAGNAGYWLCRSGRRALHEALRREPPSRSRRRLWIPAFICRGLVPAAEAAGYEVALYDIDEQLRPRRDRLDARAGDAVLVAHFFGVAQPLDDLAAALRDRGVTMIEDCAHLLCAGYDGAPTGHAGDWAIFSLRKQLPVACGGMLLGRGVAGQTAPRVSHRLTPRHALLMAERVGPAVFGRFYCGLVEWTREKLDPVRGPDGWRADDEDAIGATTLRALRRFDVAAIADRRCANYRALAAMLGGVSGVAVPFPELPSGSVPMTFPIVVGDGARTAKALWKRGVGAFLWPGFEVLPGVDWTRFPGTRRWLDHLVCLPVHQDVDIQHLRRVGDACAAVALPR